MSSSYIELTIPGPGISRVFYENKGDIYNSRCPSTTFPDEIHINNIKQHNISYEYYLNNSANMVRLVYNSNLQTMHCLFYLCFNITKIDFSHFNSSSVTSMGGLLHTCTSLTDINLSNFDTSKVQNMNSMFYSCEQLISLIYLILLQNHYRYETYV